MSLTRTHDLRLIHARLNIERSRINQVPMGEGGIDTAMQKGDVFLVDLLDNGRADGRGVVAWIGADNWRNPRELYAHQIWGPSRYLDLRERHLDILIDVCQWGIDHAVDFTFTSPLPTFPNRPIQYARDGHVLTVLADQFADVRLIEDGRFSETTLATARVTLGAERVARGGLP